MTVIVERNASINEPVKVIVSKDTRTVLEEPQPGPLVFGRRLILHPRHW